jgi:hypothetical protein
MLGGDHNFVTETASKRAVFHCQSILSSSSLARHDQSVLYQGIPGTELSADS